MSRTCTRSAGWGTFDAAVITKDDDGKVHVNKDETATRHGGWGGAAVGGLIGSLLPPTILARCGGRGRGRRGSVLICGRDVPGADVKQLGDLIDAGQAALLVIGESTVQQARDKAGLKAEKQVAKELDVSSDDIDAAIQQATSDVS